MFGNVGLGKDTTKYWKLKIWEFKCEVDYRKEKKGAIWVLNYN